MRMLQGSCDLDLAQEALRPDGSADFGVQHLDSHIAPVLDITGEIHRGHAALPELALQRIAVRERGFQRVEQFAQNAQQVEIHKDTADGPLSEAASAPY